MLIVGIVVMGLSSCTNDDTGEQLAPDEVRVYFVCTLDVSSGRLMARAKSHETIFGEFYEKIKTGELVAPSYELTMTEVNTGETYTFKGQWGSHTLVTMRTGTYRVVGTSTAEGENMQDKCSFRFDEQIDIDMTTTAITLHANYDCFLLIFDSAEIQTLQNYNGEALTPFYTFGEYRYAFVNGALYNSEKQSEAYIGGQYTSGVEFKVFTGNLNFEKGKYYVYNSVSNGFDIPPMEEGSTNREIEGFGRVANAVDLGLSVKWASWNIGASKIADYGGLYGAGDPTGLKTSTNYSDYYWAEGANICGTQYDLAHVLWGGNWRLPTINELIELKENCTWQYDAEIDGIKGSIATGPNGNKLFFPHSGVRHGSQSIGFNEWTSLWSGDEGNAGDDTYPPRSYKDFDINLPNGSMKLDGNYIYDGQSIRPVQDL